MKINHAATPRQPLEWLIIICLPLASSLLGPVTAYSDTTTGSREQAAPGLADTTTTLSNTPASNPEAGSLSGNPSLAEIKPAKRKKTLDNNSRDLSAFFMTGIAINIIMAVTFAWWFSRQWRLSGK